MKKKILVIALVVVMAASMVIWAASISNEKSPETKPKTTATTTKKANDAGEDISAGGWNIHMLDTMRKEKLENVTIELGYTNATENKFVKEANEGKEYFLIKLNLSKATSTQIVSWDKMMLTDSKGNTYTRCEDTFISELGMKRLSGTDMNFGTNEGWIAYEINKDAEGLELSYAFDSDKLEYSFK